MVVWGKLVWWLFEVMRLHMSMTYISMNGAWGYAVVWENEVDYYERRMTLWGRLGWKLTVIMK